jgi:ribonuclease BN (tRNA processing enzyme)
VTILGSGTALPTAQRASSGYLVEWHGGALLLDAAAGTWNRALRAGLDPLRLRAIAFSHLHPDHTGDLIGILWAHEMDDARTAPLRFAGPDGIARLVERARSLYEPWGDWFQAPVEIVGYPTEFDGMLVEAFPASHSPDAVCLRLTASGVTLAYSGDTEDCPGLREACRGADLALLECTANEPTKGHMTPADCERVVQAARPREVLLTHLGEGIESDLPLAEDGMTVRLRGS